MQTPVDTKDVKGGAGISDLYLRLLHGTWGYDSNGAKSNAKGCWT